MLVFILVVLSVIAAIVPMLTFLAIVWWLDRYDREPIWMVALTFFWGAFGGTGLSLLGNTSLHLLIARLLGADQADWMGPVIVAPLIEEPTKAIILIVVAMSRHFDNTTDGFVYGAAAGLGFGMTENMLYFYQVSQVAGFDVRHGIASWVGTVAIRTFYSAVMHATASSLIGAAIGWSRFRGWPIRLPALFVGLLAAMGMHALWNGLLTLGDATGTADTMLITNLIILPLEVLTVFGIFQLCLLAEKRMLVRELTEESDRGLIPQGHVEPLCSYFGRHSSHFLLDTKLQGAYIKAATALAMRKHQARQCPPAARAGYENDIERLRREVRGLLEHADQE